jgi:hypothetical protein
VYDFMAAFSEEGCILFTIRIKKGRNGYGFKDNNASLVFCGSTPWDQRPFMGG